MKRIRIILLIGCCWGGMTALQAQDRPAIPSRKADSIVRMQFRPLPMTLSIDWLREEVDPIQRQRRELRKMMEQRAQQSVLLRPQGVTQHNVNNNTGLMKVTIGNTAADNWSQFPDRALDARTIRYPLPKGASPDKRTESMKRIDRLKGINK